MPDTEEPTSEVEVDPETPNLQQTDNGPQKGDPELDAPQNADWVAPGQDA